MAWPTSGPTLDGLSASEVDEVRAAWSSVANAVTRFEPVTLVVDPADSSSVGRWLDAGIEISVAPLDDCWMRDIGPTFVIGDELMAVDWVFNGWGAQPWSSWEHDQAIARHVATSAHAPIISSPMVNEGGGIHVDGAGTVLVTETVQLDQGRNPGWDRAQVEAELHRTIGTERVIWLPRGLTRDYEPFGTRGHVDIVAAFAGPSTVLYHDQRDPEHPDYEVSALVRETLEAAGGFDLVAVAAPTALRDESGWVDWSYINHYVVNGGVILCAFDDPNDELARQALAAAYPDREIVLVDARPIFDKGGGIHCITQQQPLGASR
jgi:agmatine deiminase